MLISITASKKIKILSFFSTISVIIIHTNYLELYPTNSISWWVGNIIRYAQHWAVPFFFMISGFFFDRQFREERILGFYSSFVLKKMKSLVVPYLLWGAIYGTLLMTPLMIGVAWTHGSSDLLSKTVFSISGTWSKVDAILGITSGPLNGALWYVRILILVFISAPLWIGLFRLSRWIGVVLGFTLILLSPLEGTYSEAFSLPFLGMFYFKLNALGWIFLGMGMSQFNLEEKQVSQKVFFGFAFLWGIFSFLPLCWLMKGLDVPQVPIFLHRLSPLVFVISYWYLGDKLSQRLPTKLPLVFSLGFWIYCMHHPITGYMSAFYHLVFGHTLLADWFGQFTAFFAVFVICSWMGLIVKRFLPRLFTILSGGR